MAGMVVFIEHRYYGESLPFGDTSFQTKDNRAYLNSEQALADFSLLITNLKVANIPQSKSYQVYNLKHGAFEEKPKLQNSKCPLVSVS